MWDSLRICAESHIYHLLLCTGVSVCFLYVLALVEHGHLRFPVPLFCFRWIRIGKIHVDQLPLSDGPVLQRLPRPISKDQEDCSGMSPDLWLQIPIQRFYLYDGLVLPFSPNDPWPQSTGIIVMSIVSQIGCCLILYPHFRPGVSNLLTWRVTMQEESHAFGICFYSMQLIVHPRYTLLSVCVFLGNRMQCKAPLRSQIVLTKHI